MKFHMEGAGQSSLQGSPSGDRYSLPPTPLAYADGSSSSGAGFWGLALSWDLKLQVALSNSALTCATLPRRACICLGPRIRNPSRSTKRSSVPRPTDFYPLLWSLAVTLPVMVGGSACSFMADLKP